MRYVRLSLNYNENQQLPLAPNKLTLSLYYNNYYLIIITIITIIINDDDDHDDYSSIVIIYFWYKIIITITVSGFLWGLLINILTVSWRYYLLFMAKYYDHCGYILPANGVDIAICYINIRSAQSSSKTLIGAELKTTLAFINVSVSWRRVWRWADLSLDVLLVISSSCEWALIVFSWG